MRACPQTPATGRLRAIVRPAMWALNNTTPYAAERNWVRDKQGRHHWAVAVKATFDIGLSGALKLADEQLPPALAPEYSGVPGNSSLRWDSDLLYVKPATDVIAEAWAHAPRGKPCTSMPVSLRVGPVHKQLLVHGPRSYHKGMSGISMTDSEKFDAVPLRYESAYGGIDTNDQDSRNHRIYSKNPVGKGFAVRPETLSGRSAPTLEYPGRDLAKSEPAGFGPLDAGWSPRLEHAGTYDATWAVRKKPLLPDDYNELHASSAPADQRVPQFLSGGEPVELIGLSEAHVLRFMLPKIHLTYRTQVGRRSAEHHGRLVTVLLLPEQRQVALVWQSTLYVATRDCDYLDETVIGEKPYLA